MVRSAPPGELARAASALKDGRVVAVPTDTVYGLAALARSPQGCRTIFELKDRPVGLGLPVLTGGLEEVLELAAVHAYGRLVRLADSFWPGPLTVVVEAAPGAPGHLGGDGVTVGLRAPDEPVVQRLCELVGPLAVTSANRHGAPPCTSAGEVEAAFPGLLAQVLDAGPREGIPSSVVSIVGKVPVLLREGPVHLDQILAALEG